MMQSVYESQNHDSWPMAALAQDMLRRGWITTGTLERVVGPSGVIEALQLSVQSLLGHGVEQPDPTIDSIDYMALLQSKEWNARGQPKR